MGRVWVLFVPVVSAFHVWGFSPGRPLCSGSQSRQGVLFVLNRLVICSWLGGCYRFHLLGHPNSSFSTVVFCIFREHPFYHPAFPIDSLLASSGWPTARIKFLNSRTAAKPKQEGKERRCVHRISAACIVLGGSLVTIGSGPIFAVFGGGVCVPNRARTVFPPGPNSHRGRQACT